MTIYEINSEIELLLEQLEPDPETGEITDVSGVADKLSQLNMEKTKKLEACAKAYFEAAASANSLKTEKERLAKKQTALENKAERILNFLAFIANGEKMDCGIATLSFPKPRASTVVTDADSAATWLQKNGYVDFYTPTSPKLSINDIKKLLSDGVEIPGVHLEYKQKAVLK